MQKYQRIMVNVLQIQAILNSTKNQNFYMTNVQKTQSTRFQGGYLT